MFTPADWSYALCFWSHVHVWKSAASVTHFRHCHAREPQSRQVQPYARAWPVYTVMLNKTSGIKLRHKRRTWRPLVTGQGNEMTNVMCCCYHVLLLLSCICDFELGSNKGEYRKLAEMNRFPNLVNLAVRRWTSDWYMSSIQLYISGNILIGRVEKRRSTEKD